MTSYDDHPSSAYPITRARGNSKRQAAGLHKLRKGREQCTATRRDGKRCRAPAVKGSTVCRRHGGAAPQVLFAAQRLVLLEARHAAYREWQQAMGTGREFDARCKFYAADRDVREWEARLDRLAELKAAVKRLRTGDT